MPQITQKNRTQIAFKSLEDAIEKDNPVRFIDAFVEKLALDKLGFADKTKKPKKNHQREIKRSLNILGMQTLMEKLKNWQPDYSKIKLCAQKNHFIKAIKSKLFFETKIAA